MPYFNGDTYLPGRRPYVPTTRVYCDACAETEIPLPARTVENDGSRHWGTGFRWCGHYGGATKCHKCGAPV